MTMFYHGWRASGSSKHPRFFLLGLTMARPLLKWFPSYAKYVFVLVLVALDCFGFAHGKLANLKQNILVCDSLVILFFFSNGYVQH